MNPTPENMLRPVFVAVVLGLVVSGFNTTAQCQATGKHDFDTLAHPATEQPAPEKEETSPKRIRLTSRSLAGETAGSSRSTRSIETSMAAI